MPRPRITKKTFHLGKKAYSFQVDSEHDVVLLGKSEFDPESQECTLTLFSAVVEAGAAFNPERLPTGVDPVTLGQFKSRSDKFKTGDFTDKDAQRYIKSRYRDPIREMHRHSNSGPEVLEVIEQVHRDYQRGLTTTGDSSTSAELAQVADESPAPAAG